MAARKPKPPEPPAGLLAACPNDWIKVWIRVRAHPSVKLVGTIAAAYFANYDDGAGIYPGTVKLAAACGEMSERTVKQALAQIRGWGLMWRYVEGSKHGRRGVADTYRLTIPADVLARVPMLTPGLKRPEQVSSEHVLTEHVFSATGTGELSDTEQVNSQHPTSVGTSSSTTPYIERPVADATVEGVGCGEGKASPESSRDKSQAETGQDAAEAERRRQLAALEEIMRQDGAVSADISADISADVGTNVGANVRAKSERRGCPRCGQDVAVMPDGRLRPHGPRNRGCKGQRPTLAAAP
jgi:hypothetical protein